MLKLVKMVAPAANIPDAASVHSNSWRTLQRPFHVQTYYVGGAVQEEMRDEDCQSLGGVGGRVGYPPYLLHTMIAVHPYEREAPT